MTRARDDGDDDGGEQEAPGLDMTKREGVSKQ